MSVLHLVLDPHLHERRGMADAGDLSAQRGERFALVGGRQHTGPDEKDGIIVWDGDRERAGLSPSEIGEESES